MNRVRAIQLCGWVGIVLSVVLATAAIWGYAAYHESLTNLETPVKDTVLAASKAVGEMARTAQSGAGLAEGLLLTLQSARKTVQVARESSIQQARLLPTYARGVRDAAETMRDAAESMRKAGDALDVEVPLMKGRPFANSARSLYELATRTSSVSTTLYELSGSLGKDGAAATASFTDLCDKTLKLIVDAESATASVRAQNLPQTIAVMEQAAATLQQAGGQVEQARRVGIAMLVFGLALAGACAALSGGLLLAAATMPIGAGAQRA